MTNEIMFYELCNIMANLEDTVNSFEKIGFIIEPDGKGSVGTNIYNAASIAYNIANTLLEFPDIGTENDVCNKLLSAGTSTIEEVSKEVWNKYGIKQNIQ